LKRGFTMIELVVALGLMSVVMLFVFQTFSYQHSTYTVVDQVSEAHQTSQAAARLLERDLRNAGYMVIPGAAACGVDATDGPDTLFVSDSDAIDYADELDPEYRSGNLGILIGSANKPSSVGASATIALSTLVVDDEATYDLDADGTMDSDFRVNAGVIVSDRLQPQRGVACGIVTAVATSPASVTVTWLTLMDAGTVQLLALVPAHVYQVSGGDPPELRRDGALLAKDVEDLQLAWFYDDDVNGEVDTDEIRGVSGNDYDTGDVHASFLREVRFNLVTRTRIDDPRNPDDAGVGQARENRDTNIPGDDGKHRRVHTATVLLRNTIE
jgi:prepilin-type N-terminal cleavage/methylation domain-containing protein